MFTYHESAALKSERRDLRRNLRQPALMALLIAVLFFGGGIAWSLYVPLASAALATGSISPEGHRKTVQHLEGGIVREIRVTDGDLVERGDVLLVLEDTQARAAYRAQETRYLAAKALEARLAAERAGEDAVTWRTVPDLPGRAAAVYDQWRIFETTNANLNSQRQILAQRILQLEEEILGLREQIKSDTNQMRLLDDEIDMMRKLGEKGLSRKPRLLELKRIQAGVAGQRAANRAAIARAEQTVGETQLQILSLDTERRDQAANRLGDVRAEIADLEERMAASRDVLTRTVVRAPVSGVVFELQLQTTGGVLRPGDPILDIVPEGDDLLVDARISPTDIDVVAEGLEAEVTLTAFPQRNLPKLKGRVRHVSADRMADRDTGEVYYLARIEIDRDGLAALGDDMELVPGMPADTMIFTGARTFMEYLVGPLLDSIDKSFRES